MKFKDIVLLAFPILAFWFLQNYVFHQPVNEATCLAGQKFSAPQNVDVAVHKPLKVEIDFDGARSSKPYTTTVIENSYARYEFSTAGATLSRVEFLRNWGGQEGYLSTVFAPSLHEREKGSFLVALDEQTPYNFNLESNTEDVDKHALVYTAKASQGTITKTFEIYKNTPRIDLKVELNPSKGVSMQPRIFWISPYVIELGAQDVITGMVNEARGIKVLPKQSDTFNSYWARPTLFGTQDRYFIHALVKDHDGYAQRGYFNMVDGEAMYSILEGPRIEKAQKWQLTFFVGPKEDQVMRDVDPRLINTLNYGMFGFISKPLSQLIWAIIQFIYNNVIPNYGWAIIILTILFKLILLPFTYRAEEGLKRSGELQKKLQYLQAKHKDDPQALAAARAELFRKQGFPMLGGCSLLFLQFPIMWALSILLANYCELFKAPFLWVPDLTSSDPWYILPVLAGLGVMLHTQLQTIDTQQRMSSAIMAITLSAFSTMWSAGIVLYIVVSSFLGVIQALVIKRLRV